MTREEAIYRLENMTWIRSSDDDRREDIQEAIDMAIEALQWQDRILTQIEDIVLKEHGERREL